MSKSTINSGKEWTKAEIVFLKQLAAKNTPTGIIALKLRRTEDAVRTQASKNGISLAPTNQMPYNRKKS